MKSGFLGRLMDRLDRLDPESLQRYFRHLAQEKGLLETIFDAIQEGLVVLNADGRVTYLNRAAAEMMGLSEQETAGQPFSQLIRTHDWQKIMRFDPNEWDRLVRQEVEVFYPRHRILTLTGVPLNMVEKRARGVLLMLRDITRDREQEANLLENERINAVRLLAAGVAHEIGNPLNALNIHLQLLERETAALPESSSRRNIQELVSVAREEVRRLDAILTQFLNAVRPSKPRLEPLRLEDTIQETLALLQPEIENRGVNVRIELPGAIPAIRGDRDQLKQAFFNVIKNALDVLTTAGQIDITLATDDSQVSVTIRDNGPGIQPEVMGRIFEPYFTTKSAGHGLGLMIVQRIVQDHGGRIEVSSDPGKGTAFVIRFPLAERRLRLLQSQQQPSVENSSTL